MVLQDDSTTCRLASPAISSHPLNRRRRHTIYLAAPLPAYGLPLYDAARAHLRKTYPEPRHRVLSARELFSSSPDWRRRYRRGVLEPVTALYLVLYADQAGHGCHAEWLELAGRGVPAFCFINARTVVPIGSFEPSGNPDPCRAWHVFDHSGRRIVAYRFTAEDEDRTRMRVQARQRGRDFWLRRGAPLRRARGGR